MKILSVASKYSQQPEEKLITISRIGDASCPFRYFKNYIEKPKQKTPFETIEAGMGSFFHNFLDTNFRNIQARNEPISQKNKLDIADLLRNFRMSFIWEGKLIKPYRIVTYNASLNDFIERLRIIGENFNSLLHQKLIGHRVVASEGELQIQTDSYYIRGKYDLITKDTDDKLVLWDWKSGRMPSPMYFESFRNQKIQLGIYAIWMRYKFKSDNIKAMAVFLRDGVDLLSEVFDTEIERDVMDFMAKWRTNLNSFSSYPAILSSLCNWCGWNSVCPEHQSTIVDIDDNAVFPQKIETSRVPIQRTQIKTLESTEQITNAKQENAAGIRKIKPPPIINEKESPPTSTNLVFKTIIYFFISMLLAAIAVDALSLTESNKLFFIIWPVFFILIFLGNWIMSH